MDKFMTQSLMYNQPLVLPQATYEVAKYVAERSFSAAKYEEVLWDKLLPNDAESYRYHLAFEIGKVEGFKTGYIAVKRNSLVICIAPYFVMDYRLDTTVQGGLKRFLNKITHYAPKLLSIKMVCVGSPVTDSCKIGLAKDYPFDAAMLKALCDELEQVAKREKASVIAFKDVMDHDAQLFSATLNAAGYGKVANMPIAINLIQFTNIDEYFATLSYTTRKNLRRKLKAKANIHIEEYDGLPPDIEKVYQLYLNTYEQSELKFEKLTLEFFESIPGLMPNHCRFVLYYAENQLIAFNLLLHRDGILLDKYIGLDKTLAKKYNIYYLSWLHNVEMCIRDGFHTYQSGQAAYETKIRLGATLEQTYIFFKHCNPLWNKPLKLLSRALAYANFDDAVKDKPTNARLTSYKH
ncbi:MAG: GNAT family N-acetyltransferase [Methylophilaceae bacterium]|nr:GNAT family N-acetyltransferase [Methylophilaceae bacterium]